MTGPRAVVALGTLRAIARQMTYPSARIARLTAAKGVITSTSTAAILTASGLRARARNVAALATAIAFLRCAAAATESAGAALGLGAIARDVAFLPTAIAFRLRFRRTVPRCVALQAAIIAGGCGRLGAARGLVSKSTAVVTSSSARHVFFCQVRVSGVRVWVTLVDKKDFETTHDLGFQGKSDKKVVVVGKEEKVNTLRSRSASQTCGGVAHCLLWWPQCTEAKKQ